MAEDTGFGEVGGKLGVWHQTYFITTRTVDEVAAAVQRLRDMGAPGNASIVQAPAAQPGIRAQWHTWYEPQPEPKQFRMIDGQKVPV